MSEKPRKVLLIQLKRVGDVLLCTPLIRALRSEAEIKQIAFLTEEHNLAVLEGNPHLDDILTIPPRMGLTDWVNIQARLRHMELDCAIDLSGTPRSCTLTALSGAGVRVGFRVRAPRRFVYNRIVIPDRSKYTVDRRLDLVRELGIAEAGFEPELHLDAGDRKMAGRLLAAAGFPDDRPLLGIAPTSRKESKRWTADGFARVAAWARSELGLEILLLSGHGEAREEEETRGRIPNGARRLPETPSLRVLAALIERCQILLANDGGPKHLGVAVGTPTVTVFVSTASTSWHPPGDRRHVAVQAGAGLDPEVQEVQDAIRGLLGGPTRDSSSEPFDITAS